ncbi:putative transmembrane protein 17 [Schistosoma mansoni]|uniref:Putative transmembrane protein 17 n=1 Tax=Schistosoma mansoni TaxID=6183 RepID=G4VHQ1_SCHMA|nr:putative transmembrane protein 17 [Schistosoma mansoni]|eukprot:XP_018652517.1 putative transmembrane protein 17 [Schistosoma mansoni]
MSKNAKRALKSVADYLFLSKNAHGSIYSKNRHKEFEYVTNLPLQMSFYFNSLYSPFWFIGTLMTLIMEFEYLDPVYKVINTAVFVLYSVLEGLRLYLGYAGNLMELVPELTGSWLLTILIQLPAISFMLFNSDMILSSFERTIHIIEFIMVVFESLVGFFVLKLMVQTQALKFHSHLRSRQIENFENKSFEYQM